MLTQVEAKRAAFRVAASGFIHLRILTAIALVAISLGGCLRADPPLVGGDPADPGAAVANIHYRSATAPYTRMRPTAPGSWSGNAPTAVPDAESK